MNTEYFWAVTIVGVLVAFVGLLLINEVSRRNEARRRAEVHQAWVAATGAVKTAGEAMRGVVPAADQAAAAFRRFGEAFQQQPGRHR